MISLNKILLEIMENHTGTVLLLENNGSEIKDFLKKNKIAFKNISLNNDVIDDGMLILSPTDSNIIESYNKFGNVIDNLGLMKLTGYSKDEVEYNFHQLMKIYYILPKKINEYCITDITH